MSDDALRIILLGRARAAVRAHVLHRAHVRAVVAAPLLERGEGAAQDRARADGEKSAHDSAFGNSRPSPPSSCHPIAIILCAVRF